MKTTTHPEILTTWIVSLNVFNPVRGICAILAVGLVACGASTPSALATSITVGNPSFEIEGTQTGGWYALPDGGSWVEGQANLYQILDISPVNTHFPSHIAPQGSNVLNLATASPMTQDLSTPVSNGYLITMSFYLGNSANQADPPASPTASFTLDGSDVYSEIVTNDAANGAFVLKTLQWTATSAGNLGIKFTSTAGCWLDNISVTVIDPTTPTASVQSVDGIIGAAQVNADQPDYYVDMDSGLAGGAGSSASLTRYTMVPVVGFALPTLPAGYTVDVVTVHYKITGYRYQDNPNFTADVYLLNSDDPSGTGTNFYYMGPSDSNSDVEFVGSTDLPDATSGTTITADPVIECSHTLTGNALSMFQGFYNGNTPAQAEVFVRFNRSSIDGALGDTQIYERFSIDTAAENLYIEISSSAPPAGAIIWSSIDTTNITATTAWPTATVNTNSDVTVLVWDSVDHEPGTTNDWPVANRMSLGSKSAGVVTAQITGLSADSNLVWRIYGENSETNGWSAAVPFETALTAGQTPAFTNATAVSGTSVELGWDDASTTETGFVLQRSTVSNGTYNTIASDISGTTYTDSGLTMETTYYYRVAATNTGNGSATPWSNLTSATTPLAPVTVALYPFTGSSLASTDTDTGSSASSITGSGKVYSTIDTGEGSPAPSVGNGMIMNQLGDSLSITINADNYYSFTITPEAGKELDFESFSFDFWKNLGGADVGAAVFFGAPGFSPAVGDALDSIVISAQNVWTLKTVDLSAAIGSSYATAVEFRIYIWSAGTGSNPIRVDNIEVVALVTEASTIDEDPPQPVPAFDTAPVCVSGDTVVMVSTVSADAKNEPVEYLFTNTFNGLVSGWSTSRQWVNDSLLADTEYGYRVKARDAVSNETVWSSPVAVTTVDYLASYQFDGGSFASIDVNTESATTDLVNGSGVPLGTSSDDGGDPVAPALALTYSGLGDNLSEVIQENNYYTFTVTPGAGRWITYGALLFNGFNSGGSQVGIWVLSSLDGFDDTSAIDSLSLPSVSGWTAYSMDISGLGAAVPVTFRIYLSDSGASTGSHRIRLDNIRLSGTVESSASVFRFR